MASSTEVAQPVSDHMPITNSSSQDFLPTQKPAWGGAGTVNEPTEVTSPWGGASLVSPQKEAAISFRDLMSEDLVKDIQEKENEPYYKALIDDKTDISNLLNLQELEDTSDDLILAQMLQYEFDREYDHQVNREEKQYNGNSKVAVSFNKFRICPTWYGPDSDDELREVDDENRAIDSFEARERKDPVIPSCGYVKHGRELVTKHDLKISGRKNAERIMNLPPGINTGDGGGFDMHLPNKVFNKLYRSAMTDIRRRPRAHDKGEKATAELALDPKTRRMISKLMENTVLKRVNRVISSGKESVVLHAEGGELEDRTLPEDCAMKVFKRTLNGFKTRERYIREAHQFKNRISKNNTQKLIRLWAEKEFTNLQRLHRAEIPSPEPILIQKHILLMSFIGNNPLAAPKLKEACLSFSELCLAYEQVIEAMVKMFHGCHLVHADLSEYNILWYENKCWIIDLGQAVEPTHPRALHFLHRDCTNIIEFFHSKGLPKLPSPLQLFEKISGISLPGPEESAQKVIEMYETQQEFLRKGIDVNDQFKLLWQEIKAEENRYKESHVEEDDDDEEEEEDDEEDDEKLEEMILLDENGKLIEPIKKQNSNEKNTTCNSENLQDDDDVAGEENFRNKLKYPENDSKLNVGNPMVCEEQLYNPSFSKFSAKSSEKQSKKGKSQRKKNK